MPGRLEFEFTTPARSCRLPATGAPLRILVLAPLRGTASPTQTLAGRRVHLIDADNAERVFSRLAPSIRLTQPTGAASQAIELGFRRYEDLHPDALFSRAPVFETLRQTRATLADPTRFAPTAAALGLVNPVVAGASGRDIESHDETLTRLLGRAPARSVGEPSDAIERILRETVTPYITADTAGLQAEVLAAYDARLASLMRAILHHPEFQRLEAAWRGVWKLVHELDTGELIHIGLFDLSREELEKDLHAHAYDLTASALYRVLCQVDGEDPETARWSMVVCDQIFGAGEADMAMLAALGLLAMQAGTPVLAGAAPALLGVPDICDLDRSASMPPLPVEVSERWQCMRRSPWAPWLGLAAPRVLLRLPYGSRTDPIDAFPFEEFEREPHHEHYLWGNPAFALAWLVGRGFAQQGWEVELDDCLELDDLPSNIVRDADGEAQQQACAEVYLSESVAHAMLDRGVMPIMSHRSRNTARLVRWQSLADPPKRLAGPWS